MRFGRSKGPHRLSEIRSPVRCVHHKSRQPKNQSPLPHNTHTKKATSIAGERGPETCWLPCRRDPRNILHGVAPRVASIREAKHLAGGPDIALSVWVAVPQEVRRASSTLDPPVLASPGHPKRHLAHPGHPLGCICQLAIPLMNLGRGATERRRRCRSATRISRSTANWRMPPPPLRPAGAVTNQPRAERPPGAPPWDIGSQIAPALKGRNSPRSLECLVMT